MKQKIINNLGQIIGIIGVIALVAFLIIFSKDGKNEAPSNSAASADDHHSSSSGSSQAINNLAGKPSPYFSFTDGNGEVYSSENLRGKNVVLFFNEGLMCYPACWNQIVALAEDQRFQKDDTIVLSVVVDPKEEWEKETGQMPALKKALVVFDEDGAASKSFGVLGLESSMHKGLYPGHTYILIDKEGIIKYAFDDPQMGIRNNQLMAEIAKLSY